MTLKEVIIELRGKKKVYHEVGLKQAYFSQMLSKIESGICKPDTCRKFLALFGYEVERELLWRKK